MPGIGRAFHPPLTVGVLAAGAMKIGEAFA